MNANRIYFLETVEGRLIQEVLKTWHASQREMGILAFVPEAENKNIALLQNICTRMGIPLMGAVFPGLLFNNRFHLNGIILLRFDEKPFFALHSDLNIQTDSLRDRIGKISGDIKSRLDKPRESTLLMLFDVMVPNIATIMDGLYLELADNVHYMGANAGSERFKPIPCLFDNESIIQNGMLAILLKSHCGGVLEHGYLAPERTTYATSTQGNRIISIDWRPAFEVYRDMAMAYYRIDINKENFYQYAVHFPFGMVRANGEIVVRIPVILEDDGSIFCVGEVPPNTILTLLRAPEVDSQHTVGTIVNGLKELSGCAKGGEILAFYCAGRRIHLGEKPAENELLKLSKETGALKVAGAISLGEIGSSRQGGYPLFHNGTILCAYWGR